MVFPTACALRGRVKQVAASISWHLFSVRLLIRFFFSSRRLDFVRRWWELRWVRVSLRLWREELVNRNSFLVDNCLEGEIVGDNARDLLLLPENSWFSLHPLDRPDWSLLEVQELEPGVHDIPEEGDHGYQLRNSLPCALDEWSGLRYDERAEVAFNGDHVDPEFAFGDQEFVLHRGVREDFAFGGDGRD